MRRRLACTQKLRRRGDFQLSSIFGHRGDDSGKLLRSLGLFRRFQQHIILYRRVAGVGVTSGTYPPRVSHYLLGSHAPSKTHVLILGSAAG